MRKLLPKLEIVAADPVPKPAAVRAIGLADRSRLWPSPRRGRRPRRPSPPLPPGTARQRCRPAALAPVSHFAFSNRHAMIRQLRLLAILLVVFAGGGTAFFCGRPSSRSNPSARPRPTLPPPPWKPRCPRRFPSTNTSARSFRRIATIATARMRPPARRTCAWTGPSSPLRRARTGCRPSSKATRNPAPSSRGSPRRTPIR